MRIALVSQAYPPDTGGGGISTQTHAKAHGLAVMGHDVHVISHSTDAARQEYLDGQVYVTRIPGFDAHLPICSGAVRWLTYSSQVAAAIAELHAGNPLDLVDFPGYGAEGYVHLLNRAEWNHIPTVLHLHGPLVMLAHTIGWPEADSDLYRVSVEIEGICIQKADAILSSSRCSAEWCAKCYGLDPERVPIIHTGIDAELFRPLHVPKDDRSTIIFVGKLVANKGVEDLVSAGCRLADEFPGLRIRLVGGGDEGMADRLRAVAGESGKSELLDIVGFAEQESLPELLSRAHVFAAPSHYERAPASCTLRRWDAGCRRLRVRVRVQVRPCCMARRGCSSRREISML